MKTNNTLDENTIKLLKSFIGKKLIELKHDPIIFSYTSYGVVYLNISKNIYSITDFYENFNCFDENNDISVLKINSNIKEVKSYLKDTNLISVNVNQKINSITIVNGASYITKNNSEYVFEDTYGIIFTLEDNYQFAFEKDDYGENIRIYRGYNLIDKFKYLKNDFETETYDQKYNPKFEFNIIDLK